MIRADEDRLSSLLPTAETLLRSRWGSAVRLGQPARVTGASPRSAVWRLTVLDGPSDAPASVILKSALSDQEEPYDPEASGGGPAWRLFNEWAGLQFLERIFAGDPPAPRLYGGDRARGFIVMEDMGAGENLLTPLLAHDPLAATDAVVDLMRIVGRMHARSIGHHHVYARLRGALGPTAAHFSPAAEACFPPGQIVATIHATLAALRLTPVRGMEADLRAVRTFWARPGPFLAFTQGDVAPGNEVRRGRERTLVDFELSGMRHALTEGVSVRMHFLTGGGLRLPDAVARQMEQAYRAELIQGCPEAGDDLLFARGLVEACGYVTSALLSWAMPGILERDEVWGLATYRQLLLRRLDVLSHTAAEMGYLEALGQTASRMAERLRSLWPPEARALPYYPAFQ